MRRTDAARTAAGRERGRPRCSAPCPSGPHRRPHPHRATPRSSAAGRRARGRGRCRGCRRRKERNDAAGTHGRRGLLGRTPPGTGRGDGEDRPGPHRRPRGPARGRGRRMGAAAGHRRRRLRVRRALPVGVRPRRRPGRRGGRHRVPPPRRRQRLVDPGVPDRARANLRTARPVVPREAWEAVNNLWLSSNDLLAEAGTREGRVRWLRRSSPGASASTASCSGP